MRNHQCQQPSLQYDGVGHEVLTAQKISHGKTTIFYKQLCTIRIF